jgi:hypothetical protein
MAREERNISMIASPPKPTRTETMIALRAQRQAVKIARDIAYPRSPERGLMSGAEMSRLLALQPVWEWGKHIAYEIPVKYIFPAESLAPRWMIWLPVGCIAAIVAAAFVIFRTMR